MSYLICSPIYWIPFDPPDLEKEPDYDPTSLARMVLFKGLIRGPGLEKILGRELFDLAVDNEMLEPIP